MTQGTDVDTTEMHTAALLVRRATERGEAEDACHFWSFDYGHEGLEAATRAFVDSADRALDQLRDDGATIADGLTTQAAAYREVDAAAADRASGLANRGAMSGPALGTRPR